MKTRFGRPHFEVCDSTSLGNKNAFVLSPLRESSRHRNQNRNSSFFSEEGFRPASEAPGMSSSVRISESFTALLEDAILREFSADKTGISYDKSPDSRY